MKRCDASTLAAIRADIGRTLTPAEIDAYLSVPVSEREREDVLELVRWFSRRYPTGADRLAYVRRAYKRWTRRAEFAD